MAVQTSLKQEVTYKLESVLQASRSSLTSWLNSIEGDIEVQAQNPSVIKALKSFTQSWKTLGGEQTSYLQQFYITENPHPTGEKENLDFALDGSTYSANHKTYHPYFRAFLRKRGYYDIFLFDTNGNLIYTVFKELDYATNLNTDKWSESDLGKVFRDAHKNSSRPGYRAFYDFKAYGPSHGAPASFISTPVYDTDGTYIGVLAFQMPLDNLNKLMQRRAGLGKTGQSYLVGSDFLMRNDSSFSEESTILKQKVDTEQVSLALAGEKGSLIGTNYNGNGVLAGYTQLEFFNTTWAILAEIETDEAFASALQNSQWHADRRPVRIRNAVF